MAIRSIELIPRRPTGGTLDQRLHPGSLRLPTYHDVLHGLDGGHDFHPRIRAILADLGLGRSHVRCFLGCLPGMDGATLGKRDFC